MSVVCPTITASTTEEFKSQVNTLSKFASRVHLDLADGFFAPKLIDVKKIWLPQIMVDIHVMYEYPGLVIEQLINLKPHMIIIHYESDANFNEIAEILKFNNIKFGVAILQQTDTEVLSQFKKIIDHVLIFSGNLGYFGGSADLGLLEKAKEIKALNSKIEIGWDGGINLSNAKTLSDHHIEVLNVGGYIHKSKDPEHAYETMVRSLKDSK
jgi:ribulose-phosphate 3-epimerase